MDARRGCLPVRCHNGSGQKFGHRRCRGRPHRNVSYMMLPASCTAAEAESTFSARLLDESSEKPPKCRLNMYIEYYHEPAQYGGAVFITDCTGAIGYDAAVAIAAHKVDLPDRLGGSISPLLRRSSTPSQSTFQALHSLHCAMHIPSSTRHIAECMTHYAPCTMHHAPLHHAQCTMQCTMH